MQLDSTRCRGCRTRTSFAMQVAHRIEQVRSSIVCVARSVKSLGGGGADGGGAAGGAFLTQVIVEFVVRADKPQS